MAVARAVEAKVAVEMAEGMVGEGKAVAGRARQLASTRGSPLCAECDPAQAVRG